MLVHVIKETKSIKLVAFGDLHFGDKSCNVPKIKKTIDWMAKEKEVRIILMGDILNCATKSSVGAAVFDENTHGQSQYEEALDMLEPVKDKIYGIIQGNHEQRIFNSTGYNIAKMLAKDLDCKYYGYATFVKIKVGKVYYTIYASHGSSGSKLPWTKIKGCLDLGRHKDADIYLYGHVHDLQLHTQDVEKIKGNQLIQDKKYFVLTGHYLNCKDSYAEMKNMIPSKQGSPMIELSAKEKQIRVVI